MKVKVKAKPKPNFDNINDGKSQSKVLEKAVSEKGDNIDWNCCSNTLDVDEMWGKRSMIKTIREVIIKFFKQEDPLEKLTWNNNRLSRKRKGKYKTWKEFGIIPSMETNKTAFSRPNE